MNLHVKEDAQPFAIQTQSLLPITIGMQSRQSWTWWWHEAFHTLDGQSFFSMLLSLVAVAMPNSGVRITTDFPGSTNHQVQCPVHPSQQYWHMDPKVHFLYQNNALCGTGWQTKLAEEDHDHLHAVAQWVLQQQGCLSSGMTWYCNMWTMHFAVTKTTSPLSSTSIRSVTGCRKHKMTNFQRQVQCVGISSSAPKMHSLFAESHNQAADKNMAEFHLHLLNQVCASFPCMYVLLQCIVISIHQTVLFCYCNYQQYPWQLWRPL